MDFRYHNSQDLPFWKFVYGIEWNWRNCKELCCICHESNWMLILIFLEWGSYNTFYASQYAVKLHWATIIKFFSRKKNLILRMTLSAWTIVGCGSAHRLELEYDERAWKLHPGEKNSHNEMTIPITYQLYSLKITKIELYNFCS